MKKQEKEQIKNKPVEELRKMLTEKREALRKFKFDLAAGKVKNIKQIQETKKDIARILTIINTKTKTESSSSS